MKAKTIVPRELASRDVDEAIEHYLSEGAEQAALGFIKALEQAYFHIGRHPATGSSRYAHELNLPGLRSWPLTRYHRKHEASELEHRKEHPPQSRTRRFL